MEKRAELRLNDQASFTKMISEEDILSFAQVSGDRNPVHLDETYAQTTMFKKRIAHGMLVASLISATIGQQLPGHGTIYLTQTLRFRAPVFINDSITATVKVIDFPKPNRVVLNTTCTNQDGKVVIEGEALVIPPENILVISN